MPSPDQKIISRTCSAIRNAGWSPVLPNDDHIK